MTEELSPALRQIIEAARVAYRPTAGDCARGLERMSGLGGGRGVCERLADMADVVRATAYRQESLPPSQSGSR